jgi:hypothetical protein
MRVGWGRAMFELRKAVVCLGVALGIAVWAGAHSAQAQVLPSIPTPPTFPAVDANGVDLFTGRLSLSEVKATVGPLGQGGLAEAYAGTVLQDNLFGSINGSGVAPTVSLNGRSARFNIAAGGA